MNCATHYIRFLKAGGSPPWAMTINDILAVPAAVTVYHGEALCWECLIDELHKENP